MKHSASAFAVVFALLISIQTTSVHAEDRLTKDQTVAHVSGNTERWKKGGAYYAPDGTVAIKWKGKDLGGTWEVDDDGTICYTVKQWNETTCHHYIDDAGTITMVYEGDERVLDIMAGNQLDNL